MEGKGSWKGSWKGSEAGREVGREGKLEGKLEGEGSWKGREGKLEGKEKEVLNYGRIPHFTGSVTVVPVFKRACLHYLIFILTSGLGLGVS